ncbi:multinuclear nonheme iron-dependent oxidase [Chitinophaga arvensicola]|uniref:Uncharacterized conserved protein, UPF0276 family n=1 Tax=Chitinophaga arvensicola TaxID=29529 RepID=A0A1I0SD93_9BACT|nr:DUF692 family multinuclear iron-containing protein [Chitinophaga arvensicola]SEW55861.1 Uncharacterized conserved protein, UPF0276 family [Chitinophaga arvensicola]
MPEILSAAACNLDSNILAACLPLMEESRLEAIEWSFDALFNVKDIPSWFLELLTAYSHEKRLTGHGVFFSLFSGKWRQEQADWLKRLKKINSTFRFDHVTEHFGFMTGKDFHHGAPLNIPYTPTTLRIGQDRLKRIFEACECPVGLENLAFSYSLEEVKKHGAFLEQLLEPVNGFIILDLHNLYCQIHNFNIPFEEILALYPLHKVREIHISGGSWQPAPDNPVKKIRRDTHDDAVPEEVFALLEHTIARCPHLKYVVLEQLGNALYTANSKHLFYTDFGRMEKIVQANNKIHKAVSLQTFLPLSPIINGAVIEDETLNAQQLELSRILESAHSHHEAIYRLSQSSLAHSAWQVEEWEPDMIATAVSIAQKWKK